MPGPGGKEVGRVSIRAVPDSAKFRKDLKVMLERAERTVTVTLPVAVDTADADVQIRRFQRKWNGQKVDLNAGLDSGVFTARMKALTRPRRVRISAEITKKSAAQVATFFAGISGARNVGLIVKNLGEQLRDLDKNLPKLTAVTLGITGLGAAGLNAVHGLGGVLVGLVQLAPLAALLPGLLFGAATGIATLVLAFRTAPRSITAVLNSYKSLQSVVGKNFWGDAAKPVTAFLKGILPQLKTGFGQLAEELGNDVGNISTVLANGFGGGVLAKVFFDARDGAAAALPGVNAFTHSFVTLLTTGASFLPAFGGWITKIGQQFDGWLTGVEASGQLQAMIQQSLVVVGQLGSSLASIGSILTGVFTAGGGDAIGGLAAGLAAVAAIVNSPTFQTALATIFAGASIGASGLAAALGPIGSMLSTLAPILSSILGSTGVVLGDILGQIATALARPEFATGLAGFFAGIQTGLSAIGPSLPALADAFGTLLQFAGQLAAQLGPVLGTVLSALAPVLITILKALEPILPILGDALISIISTLAPVVLQLVDALLPLVQMIGEQLEPVIGPLLDALMSLLTPLIQIVSLVVSAVMPALGPLLPLIAQLVSAGFGPLGDILTALMPLFQILGAVAGASMTVLGGIIRTVTDLITGNFDDIGKTWEDVWTGIQDFGKKIFNTISDALGGFINGAIDLINGLTSGLNQVLAGIAIATGGVINLQVGQIPHVLFPHLATGADVLPTRGGTNVVLGDGNQVETVTNRGRTNRLIEFANQLAARALAVSGGSDGHHFDIRTDDPVAAAMEALRLMREAEAA